MSEHEDLTTYTVVVNHEEQYSIWPVDQNIPRGWKEAGKVGPKADCLEYIKEVWTDMRPLSVRRQFETKGQRGNDLAGNWKNGRASSELGFRFVIFQFSPLNSRSRQKVTLLRATVFIICSTPRSVSHLRPSP